jgi:hypothetical protein
MPSEDTPFKPGNTASRGRPRGSRHKFSEAFLADLSGPDENGLEASGSREARTQPPPIRSKPVIVVPGIVVRRVPNPPSIPPRGPVLPEGATLKQQSGNSADQTRGLRPFQPGQSGRDRNRHLVARPATGNKRSITGRTERPRPGRLVNKRQETPHGGAPIPSGRPKGSRHSFPRRPRGLVGRDVPTGLLIWPALWAGVMTGRKAKQYQQLLAERKGFEPLIRL